MPEGWRPRGVTPSPRSGAAAKSARLRRCRNGQEELPRVQVQGRPGGATLRPRLGAAAGRNNPHIQGAVAARAQEGLEELSHTEGQEGRTLPPR